jgi:SAM-dependent methyltransferase
MTDDESSLFAWETAYQRFETPEQEVAKFTTRLRRLGVPAWPRSAHVVEIFCGRGNGLHSWDQLGFTNLIGVDLSFRLLAKHVGPGLLICADCRTVPLPDASADIVIVQGGLHHLPVLPLDLMRTLDEACRVLAPGGRFVVIEPWRTPFLSIVHAVSEWPPARRISGRLDAFATMTEHERSTYENWLGRPAEIRRLLTERFESERMRVRFGKLEFVGRKPSKEGQSTPPQGENTEEEAG